MNKYTKERTLILKKGYKRWEIDNWTMKYIDLKKHFLISGYDFYGMYYQIKFKEIKKYIKTQFTILLEVF